jgi:hypothetical protein
MAQVMARHLWWMWVCSYREEEGVGVPSGDAEQWLPPTPASLMDLCEEILGNFPPPEGADEAEWAQDMAHWAVGSGGASGYNDPPKNGPDMAHMSLEEDGHGWVWAGLALPRLAHRDTLLD